MSSKAVQVFQDAVRDAWLKSKARNKRKRRGFWWQSLGKAVEEEHIVTPDEVIREIERLGGPRIGRSTLLLWEKKGLIPAATRGSHGRGRGRYADYPPETPAEGLAAARLLQEGIPLGAVLDREQMIRLTYDEVRSARVIGLNVLEGPVLARDFAPYRLRRIELHEKAFEKMLDEAAELFAAWVRMGPGRRSSPLRIGPYYMPPEKQWERYEHEPLSDLVLYSSLRHGFRWAVIVAYVLHENLRGRFAPQIACFTLPPDRFYCALAWVDLSTVHLDEDGNLLEPLPRYFIPGLEKITKEPPRLSFLPT